MIPARVIPDSRRGRRSSEAVRIGWGLILCRRHSTHGSRPMGQPLEISRTELSASALRALAGKTADGAVVRRLLAIALVVEGRCRDEAASLNGMTRQTLRDWVHRYNAEGVEG